MICDCCEKKKRLLDMFYSMGDGEGKVNLCSECQDVARRMELDLQGGEKELNDLHRYQLRKRAKAPTEAFCLWQRELDSKIQ